jgi:transposase InsO family protein
VIKLVAWVDSQVVYCWVRNREKRYKEFVANRLNEVLEIFEKYQDLKPEVRWVPTDLNPADLVSRSCTGEEMKKKFNFWTQGPEFLSQDETQWPDPPSLQVKPEEELIKQAIAAAMPPEEAKEDPYAEFNSLQEFVQAKLEYGDVTPSLETVRAHELDLIKKIQHDCFPEEIQRLEKAVLEQEKNKRVSVFFNKGLLQAREAFLDSKGFLRVKSRLAHAEWLSWEQKYPMAMSVRHGAARLLIRDVHRRLHHEGARTTYAELVQRFHLPYRPVKEEVFKCQECREGNPIKLGAPVAVFHKDRLQARASIFSSTGMDFFGPFHLRGGRKAWGLLFTCLTTRAVHLELCPDMTIPTWLNALERFISRRGPPQKISCDRGATFIGGDRALKKLVTERLKELYRDLPAEVAQKFQIEFHFIPPRTPHYGGLWERLIKQVKRSLIKATSTVAQLNYDALNTFMARAEAIINKRPLAIGKDLQIITPEMLLNAGAKVSFATSYNITRVLGQLRQLVDHFWSVWTDQYMLQLAPHRLRPGQPGYVELRPGEAVIFQKEATQQRLPGVSTMTAGKVVQPHPSSDGIVRRYTISDAEGKAFDVPVSRIFLSEQEAVARRGQATGAVPEG